MTTLRRLLVLLSALATVATGGGLLLAPTSPAGAQLTPVDDLERGLVYSGLRQAAPESLCRGGFESLLEGRSPAGMKQVLCTHGPDPAPEGVDVRADRGPDPTVSLPLPSGATAVAETPPLGCYGTGSDGFRVQLIYARSTSSVDRYDSYEASFRAWAARLDEVVNMSAAATGGIRHVRFVTDASCNPVIQRVALSATAMSDFGAMVSALHNGGFARTDRKYLVWADSNVYCGIAEIYNDDRGDPTPGVNYNNGHPWIQGSVGRVDNGCWGLTNMVEAHELLHTLGGVQLSAPNATGGYHCNDESDRLCYPDGTRNATMRQVCPSANERLYDCRNDDYFSTAPAPGSYLSTQWNSANSAFLTSQASTGGPTTTTTAPPTTPTTRPPTTTTTRPPTTTSTVAPTTTSTVAPTTTSSTTTTATSTTTTTSTSTTTTTMPPATSTTTTPPSGSLPSAPRSFTARQPTVGPGVQLAWQPPVTGPVTGYRVYRGTAPSALTLLATVPNVLGYTDTTAGRSLYYYRVAAYNAAGQGPNSPVTGMIGKAAAASGVVTEDADRRTVVTPNPMSPPWARRWA